MKRRRRGNEMRRVGGEGGKRKGRGGEQCIDECNRGCEEGDLGTGGRGGGRGNLREWGGGIEKEEEGGGCHMQSMHEQAHHGIYNVKGDLDDGGREGGRGECEYRVGCREGGQG